MASDNPTKCFSCSIGQFAISETEITFSFGTTSFSITAPCLKCQHCGSVKTDPDTMAAVSQQVVDRLLFRGPKVGSALRFIRNHLGEIRFSMATSLGVDMETITNWEDFDIEVDDLSWALLVSMIRVSN